ncbi:MAG: hypothetical protein UW32_C0002G0003 [Candidatus Wolfebacteria bacterium GW2011_GWE2_44_13]|uniref:Transcriptional repressor PaaX-like central Cas2-like domain-containing protein n=1 Tax=Candidatus Wolfebacteria bacterium GW2011_GWE2_44_13 TaxID=1619017 RepID=A0A0G1JGM1_9BACT|nr:MAG: hypothetical protein UW32_C0002G0003 [Candidatus Wolfebacteria bacterium GW2011_GWE2_44_13]
MQYNSSQKVLEAISEGIIFPLDLFEAIIESGYGASSRKIENSFYKIKNGRAREQFKKEEEKRRRKAYASLMYKLKRDGLVKESGEGEEKEYALTVKGEQKLEILKSKDGFPDTYYTKEKSNKIIIVMFDIPEKDVRKRTWLRMVLNNLDFKMAQKSVWIGKTTIPKELIGDLMRMQLESFVEIFEVGNTGNLKNIL